MGNIRGIVVAIAVRMSTDTFTEINDKTTKNSLQVREIPDRYSRSNNKDNATAVFDRSRSMEVRSTIESAINSAKERTGKGKKKQNERRLTAGGKKSRRKCTSGCPTILPAVVESFRARSARIDSRPRYNVDNLVLNTLITI